MKICLILFIVFLFSFVVVADELGVVSNNDTPIIKNYRTNIEYVIRDKESLNIVYLDVNASKNDTFVWYAKNSKSKIIQDGEALGYIAGYCYDNKQKWIRTYDKDGWCNGKYIHYNKLRIQITKYKDKTTISQTMRKE